MGRASRRRRERRAASSTPEPVGHESDTQVPSAAESDLTSDGPQVGRGWGGRRDGAGRQRVYATPAERQAAYRARRKTNGVRESALDLEGKPPFGGAPVRPRPQSA